MLNQSIETGSNAIAILVVSSAPADHDTLRLALRGSKWKLYSASDLVAARRLLRRDRDISLVLCDREFWKQLLEITAEMRAAPLVIVAANNADEQLWAEALNVGAYDVLAKPFETAEVVRSLSLGWLYRRRESKRAQLLPEPRVAAS